MKQLKSNDIIYLNIAGFNIRINFRDTLWIHVKEKLKKEIVLTFQSFITQKKPRKIDYSIYLMWEKNPQVLFAKKDKRSFICLFAKNKKKNRVSCYYRSSIYEFHMVLNNVLFELLLKNNGLILHASAAMVNKKAYVFLGESGQGKSTLITLLNSVFPALADDKVIVKKNTARFYFYQTPFFEKKSWINKKKKRYQLGKIFFLKKANFFRITKMRKNDSLIKQLFKQIIIRKEHQEKQIQIILKFIASFNDFYYLYFAKDKMRLIKMLTKE